MRCTAVPDYDMPDRDMPDPDMPGRLPGWNRNSRSSVSTAAVAVFSSPTPEKMDAGFRATSSPTDARIVATAGISFSRMKMIVLQMFRMPES
jgi:hypothetical protein